MPVQMIERPAIRVAYRRHIGPYGAAVHAFWMNEVAPWISANGLSARPRYGISHDDPSITSASQCRYDAAVEVDDDFVPGQGVFVTLIPGGRYASTSFFGNSDDIALAWHSLLRDWLADSGMQLDSRPCFEYYPVDARYEPDSGRFGCQIMIAITPLN
jgi:AraC family transcriptional regulator